MKRIIVCLAIVNIFVACSGCGQRLVNKKPSIIENQAEMIQHIGKDHGIKIGTNADADIVLNETSNTVSVLFTPELVKRLPPDCFSVLKFSNPKKIMTPDEFGQFMENFHDYLLLTYGEGHGPKPAGQLLHGPR